MINLFIIVIFLISGAVAGWVCFEILPAGFLEQISLQDGLSEYLSNQEDLQPLLSGFGALFGLLSGFIFQNLRKKQGEYMGLSEDSLHGDYDIMRLNSKMSSRSLPPIYSEVKKAKKPKKRTQSKKRANKRNYGNIKW